MLLLINLRTLVTSCRDQIWRERSAKQLTSWLLFLWRLMHVCMQLLKYSCSNDNVSLPTGLSSMTVYNT